MADTPAAAPTEKPPVKLTIDGKEVAVPAGSTIIQASNKLSKYIPHFCYHEGLSVVGQCRMCFVEIEGAPKLATACSTPVAEGMKVLTESPKVKAGQNGTLEFTLLNHPLDCPICDRGGECKLQDYTYEYGPPISRMVDDKVLRVKHKDVSQNVVLDQERCILCTRCVRFSSEVDGRTELVVNGRGNGDVIDVFENRPMQSPFSGNVVDLCPVGALTAKDFRFQARPWELKKHDAICTGCAVGCNIEVHTKHRHPGVQLPDKRPPNPKIQRLMPRENAQVNTWWMCDKGRWGYHFHNDDSKRLHEPMIRREAGTELTEVSLREVQALMDQRSSGTWEFWVDDNAPHEMIAWAKELSESWKKRGRKVERLNPSQAGAALLNQWGTRTSGPWTASHADWAGITKVVATQSYRDLESVAPILSLKLGQRVRKGQLKWEVRDLSQLHNASDDPATTAYLVPVPNSEATLGGLAKIPATAKVLVLWTQSNSRGLLNEGLAPIESLGVSLGGKTPQGPVFYFGQRTQNALPAGFVDYLSKAPFLMIADSFQSELIKKASIVLPLTPLYESEATLTNLEGLRQNSRGVHLAHPNQHSIDRGGPVVSASLRLI